MEHKLRLIPKAHSGNKVKKGLTDAKQFALNVLKSPKAALIDAGLYLADIAGAPSNVTNYLRDLNISIPYRAKSAVRAGFETIIGNGSFEQNYRQALANPGWVTQNTSIIPLQNSEHNFSEEELEALRKMAGSDFQISYEDIERVSTDNQYGKSGSLSSYLEPSKVVQSAIGKASGNPKTKTIEDVYDFNTVGKDSEKTNTMYQEQSNKSRGINYEDIRAIAPTFNMIDIIPDRFKIHTKIQYEE